MHKHDWYGLPEDPLGDEDWEYDDDEIEQMINYDGYVVAEIEIPYGEEPF